MAIHDNNLYLMNEFRHTHTHTHTQLYKYFENNYIMKSQIGCALIEMKLF